MKVSEARKDYPCSFNHCCVFGKTIQKGEVYVGFQFNRKIRDRYIPFLMRFHPDCWEQTRLSEIAAVKERVKELKDKIALRRPKSQKRPAGRPRIYRDTQEANRIKAQIFHYRKAGNTDKVQELEHLLEKLKLA